MTLLFWQLRGAARGRVATDIRPARGRRAFRPTVEGMEVRELLSGGVGGLHRPLLPAVPAAWVWRRPMPIISEATRAANAAYLESLEARYAPGGLSSATRTTLRRGLDAGQSPEAIVLRLLRSPEVASERVTAIYRALLGRDPSAAERSQSGRLLQRGADPRDVFARVVGGAEYLDVRGGGTAEGFVSALYADLLRREPTADEAARWVGFLDRGGARSAVVRTLLNTPESLSRMAGAVLEGYPGASPIDPAAAARILGRPGGLAILEARVYGGRDYRAKAAAFVMPVDLTVTPPTSVIDVTAHPPGLPMSPTLDLNTRWARLTTQGAPAIDGTNLIAAAEDGSVWVSGGANARGQLSIYWPGTASTFPSWSSLPALPQPVQGLSAVSKDLAYAIVAGSATPSRVVTLTGAGAPGPFALDGPAGKTLTAISAATDGTLVVLSDDHQVYELNAARDGWTPLPAPPNSNVLSIAGISAGSASNIWAVTRPDELIRLLLRYDRATNAWVSDPGAPAEPSNVSAASDGTVWAWYTNSNLIFQKSPTTGAWTQLDSKIQTPPAGLGNASAASQFRLFMVMADDTLRVLSYGLTDVPAVPMLPTDQDQLAAYWAISHALGAVSPMGIRGDYDNSLQLSRITSDYNTLFNMTRPAGVTTAAWDVIKPQILLELQTVPQVYQLFELQGDVWGHIQRNNNGNLPGIEALVNASYSPPPPDQTLGLIVGAGFEAALWGAAAGAGGQVGVVLSVFASALGSVLSAITDSPNIDSDTRLDIAYSKLTDTLSNLYTTTDQKSTANETAILTDWNRLSALGRAINNPANPWVWTPGTGKTIADATQDGFEYFFLQALVPAKWQIVHYHAYGCLAEPPTYNNCPSVRVPAYNLIKTYAGAGPFGIDLYNYRFLNAVGARPDLFGYGTPYPTTDLLAAIYKFGVSQQTLYNAQGGWNLKVVPGDGG